jgi:gluconate 5-dehydrogenase
MAREVANASMIKQKYGRIINISSMAGMIGNNLERELGVPYYAAKGGVINMTRALAAEWGKYNINVNTICPGYFYTDMTKDGLDNKEFLETIKNRIPLARYAEVSELDTAVLFLASKASSYITGVCLPVDGGYTCM